MDNESEVAYVRAVMDDLPTLARSPVVGQAAGQKGGGLWATQYTGVWYPLRKRPGAKQRPNATQNGRAERWNPPTALPATGVGGQAVCLGGKDGSRSQCLTVMVRIC
jgi:hypothetical protein